MKDEPSKTWTYEYRVIDESLSEDFGIIYQGPEEEKAKEIYRHWHERSSVKLMSRRVTEFEPVRTELKKNIFKRPF